MPIKFLIPRAQYLSYGIHIGMKQKTQQMKEFIYNIRPTGLAVFNLRKVDERIRIAAKFLSRCNNILVATRKPVAFQAIKKFSEIIKCKAVTGRFMPGMLTNPSYKGYGEVDVVFVVDPITDSQAVEEAVKARVPVIALCNTFNETKDIDLIIPCNNVGKMSIAAIFWLLAREILKERGELKSDKEFKYKVEEFAGS
jgi:small subunit ribosomal protein S2